MKYRIIEGISKENRKNLLELSKELDMKFSIGSRMRKGLNSPEVVSKYWYTRWFDWTSKQRNLFKDNFHKDYIEQSVQSWFVKYEAKTGMLDDMNVWLNDKRPASIVAFPLIGDQDMNFGDEQVMVNSNQGIVFKLNELHSVKESLKERVWACVMFREY